jgi:hypothetical protein
MTPRPPKTPTPAPSAPVGQPGYQAPPKPPIRTKAVALITLAVVGAGIALTARVTNSPSSLADPGPSGSPPSPSAEDPTRHQPGGPPGRPSPGPPPRLWPRRRNPRADRRLRRVFDVRSQHGRIVLTNNDGEKLGVWKF